MTCSETIAEVNPTKGDEVMVEVGFNPDGSPWLEFLRIKRILGNRVKLFLGRGATLTVDVGNIEVVRKARDVKPKRWGK